MDAKSGTGHAAYGWLRMLRAAGGDATQAENAYVGEKDAKGKKHGKGKHGKHGKQNRKDWTKFQAWLFEEGWEGSEGSEELEGGILGEVGSCGLHLVVYCHYSSSI